VNPKVCTNIDPLRGYELQIILVIPKTKAIPCEVLGMKMLLNMLTNTQNQILYGAILGDSYVEIGQSVRRKARVRFDHAARERDYTEWKNRALAPYSTPLREVKVFDKRTGKYYKKVRFDTLTLSIFNKFRKMFYVGNTKIVPSNISRYLTSPLALAVWYLDDGGKRTDCKAYRIHTNCYSLPEVKLLNEALKNNFGVSSTIHKQGKGFLLYIGAKNGQANKFCELVKPVVSSRIPSMLHKFH
jgi:recombination protein RecA